MGQSEEFAAESAKSDRLLGNLHIVTLSIPHAQYVRVMKNHHGVRTQGNPIGKLYILPVLQNIGNNIKTAFN